MCDETEVRGGSPEVANLLKYIVEREDNLSKYSDKLRQNVEAIFNIFGNKRYCQICGKENNPGSNVDSVFVVCSNGHTTEAYL